ncbi:MAG: hypothetical protein M3463_01600 [Verrucomicrobiota bacterium]|nr:hypothetical protein [Verrucomicrobiota bacterium]
MNNKPLSPQTPVQRRNTAYQRRLDAAARLKGVFADHRNNGDDEKYPNKIGSFTKGLPHHDNGEVDLAAYQKLRKALKSGDPVDFAAIPRGCPGGGGRKFVNPQAGLAFDLEGVDAQQITIPPAPEVCQRGGRGGDGRALLDGDPA